MEVICRGHNGCEYEDSCIHSKPHKILRSCNVYTVFKCCMCSQEFLRKKKLKKLNDSNL